MLKINKIPLNFEFKRPFKFKKENSPLRVWKFAVETQIRLNFQENKQDVGIWMKNEISTLGPAFIKLGQFVSTRSTLFGKEISNEISKLQDDITQIDYHIIKESLELSLNKPLDEVFSVFDPISIGSASIGQVHKAILKSNGKEVAIKIQKPNIALLIRQDLETLRNMTNILTFFGSPRAIEFNNILDEYDRFLSTELDYIKELNNMVKFYDIIRDLPVRIPRVYRSLSSHNVLVMEYIPSIKITNRELLNKNNIDTVMIADTLINVFLNQIIKKGIVHCDPHPGNIGVLSDGKTIVLYDFGNVIEFSDKFKENLSQLVFSVVQRDVNEFVDLLIQLEILMIDDESEIAEIKSFFQYFFRYLETLDFSKLKASVVQNDIQGKFQQNLRINPDFMSLFRVFSLLDGTCSKLNSNFSYIKALQPFNQELMNDITFLDFRARKDLQKLTSYSRTLQNTDTNMIKVQNKVKVIGQEFQQTQIFIALALCIEHRNDILPWLLLMSSCVAWKIKQDRK
jgi:ubiquinone biosynthesis protein